MANFRKTRHYDGNLKFEPDRNVWSGYVPLTLIRPQYANMSRWSSRTCCVCAYPSPYYKTPSDAAVHTGTGEHFTPVRHLFVQVFMNWGEFCGTFSSLA